MAEYGKAKSRLGDEDIARNQLERSAGRIGDVLVITGDDDPNATSFDRNLRRAEHVAGRMKRHRYAVKPDDLAVADRLRRPGEIFAVAKPHQIQGFGCRQYCLVAGPGVVGMRMGDERSGDRADRIDVECARWAMEPGLRRHQKFDWTHDHPVYH